jgi:hypothetical protein
METCKHCKRSRPEYIADPSCAKGGYCEWIKAEPAPRDKHLDRSIDVKKAAPLWLPLHTYDNQGANVIFSAQPSVTFKPKGLMLFDLPPDAGLEYCRLANEEAVLAGHGPLPAKVFARAESYEKLKARVENGEEFFSEWINSVPCRPCNRLTISLRTQVISGFIHTQAAFWGVGYL